MQSARDADDNEDGLTKSGRGTGKAKAKARNPPRITTCFVMGCECTKQGKDRWCAAHKRTYDAMKKQAYVDGQEANGNLGSSLR